MILRDSHHPRGIELGPGFAFPSRLSGRQIEEGWDERSRELDAMRRHRERERGRRAACALEVKR